MESITNTRRSAEYAETGDGAMTESGKTHHDNISRIGGTAATDRGFIERRWNRYYFQVLKRTVRNMLAGEIGAIRHSA